MEGWDGAYTKNMKKILFTLTILSTLLFASCQSDFLGDEHRGGGNNSTASEEGFRLRLSVPSGSINTRATIDSQWGEEYVYTLHLLFFDASSGYFRGFVVLDEETMPDLHNGETLDLSAPLHVCLQPETARHLNNHTHYRILAVANITDFLCPIWFPENSTHTTLGQWEARFVTEVNNITNGIPATININTERNETLRLLHFNPNRQIASERLLMSAEINKPADVEEVLAPLTRAVVRLDVVLSDRVATDYELVSASVWNVPQYTSLWRSHTDFSTIMGFNLGAIQRVTYNGATDLNGFPVSDYEHLRFTSHVGFKGILYTFENRQSGIAQNCPRTTAVILGIRCKGSGITYFHRVNVHLPFAAQTLQRNTVHNIRVNHVLGQGALTEEAAYGNNNSQLQVSINDSDMDNRGVILVDGDNVLVLPTNRIVFSPEGGSREFTIFTHSPTANWRLGVSQLVTDPGISAVLTGYTLTVSATPSVDPRQGFIELEFGNIRARIEIVQTSRNVEFLYLNLQMNDIYWFDATDTPQRMEAPDGINYVRVTASGEWTARVFNEEVFGFNPNPSPADNIIRGNPDDTFFLYAINDNADSRPRYGFVIVSLLSNPNINQVLIVRQHGADALRMFRGATELITQADRTITFTPTGEPMPANTHVIRVTHAQGALTSIFADGNNGFTVSKEVASDNRSTTLTFTAPNDLVSRSNRLDITSPLGAVASIWLNQIEPTLSLTPSNPAQAPTTGGNTGAITAVTPGNWTATIISAEGVNLADLTLLNTNNLMSPSSGQTLTGAGGESFVVNFPNTRIPTPAVNPTAVVRVHLTAVPTVYAYITVGQVPRQFGTLQFRSGGDNRNEAAGPGSVGIFSLTNHWTVASADPNLPGVFDTWIHNNPHSNRTRSRNPDHPYRATILAMQTSARRWEGFALASILYTWHNFTTAPQPFFGRGSQFVVQSGARNINYYATRNATPSAATNVFSANNFQFPATVAGNTAADAIRDWLQGTPANGGRRILMINSEFSAADFNRAMTQMGGAYEQFQAADATAVTTTGATGRYVVSDNADHTALHGWLFRDGPFVSAATHNLTGSGFVNGVTDISGDVSLSGYSGPGRNSFTATTLTSWPNTFIPIIWHSNGSVVFGIDPVLGIVFLGQTCIFGYDWRGGGGASNWNVGARRHANLAFTRNLAAWIVMAAQYGDAFMEQFDPRP